MVPHHTQTLHKAAAEKELEFYFIYLFLEPSFVKWEALGVMRFFFSLQF